MHYFYPVVTGYGPQACHMEEVALCLLNEYLTDKGFELAECFTAYELKYNAEKSRIFLEGYQYMKTCLYGEFKDSNSFEIAFVDVTDKLDEYRNDMHELIVVDASSEDILKVLNNAQL